MKEFVMQTLNQIGAFFLQLFNGASEWISEAVMYLVFGASVIVILLAVILMAALPFIYLRAIIREIKWKFF